MATNENKVQFNIKNVHYAVMTADGETPTWENPVPVPGAVNLSLEASGEITPFYADGVVYYKSSSNNGYEGDLEMARFIDKMLQDVWGYVLNATDKTIIENVSVEPKSFALLFQIDGDADNDINDDGRDLHDDAENRLRIVDAIFRGAAMHTNRVPSNDGADKDRNLS